MYRLTVFSVGGSGSITLSPTNSLGLYNAGDIIAVNITPDNGYTFVNWQVGSTSVSATASFNYTMPDQDVFLFANLSGTASAPSTYGLKYFYEYCPTSGHQRGNTTRIEIEEKDFVGTAQQREIGEVSFRIGNDNSDILETITGSSLDFNLAVFSGSEYSEFLDADPKKFRVKYYRNYTDSSTFDFEWIGFLITDVLEMPNFEQNYFMQMTATDGLKTLDSQLINSDQLPGLRAIQVIAGILRQNYPDPLNLVENIEIHETRTDDTASTLNQLSINLQRLFQEDVIVFFDDDGFRYNNNIDLKSGLIRILRSFVARIYQWNGKWYLQSLNELEKGSLTFNEFSDVGAFSAQSSLSNDQEIDCDITDRARISGNLAFTEFNASLKLGSVSVPELNEILVETFDSGSWQRTSTHWRLRRWQYVRTVEFDGTRDSETARLEFVSNPTSGEAGVFARFLGTANGTADVNISYIEFNSNSSFSPIKLAVESANKITIGANFQILRRGSSDPIVPASGSHKIALQVQVGTQYLIESSPNVFTWTGTPTLVTFDVTNSGVFNTIEIKDVSVPEDGEVSLRLYQLVTISGTRHRYIVDWDDAYIALSENDDLTYEEIIVKGIADVPYPNVLPTFETFLGDALTNLSSSAFKLEDVANKPVSELWSRDGVESEPLLEIIVQILANLYAKNNYRARLSYYGDIDFRKSVQYDGFNYMINSATLDDYTGRWDLDLFRLDELTT
jgi:hypothetical protein